MELRNSIFSLNRASAGQADLAGPFTGSHNLIGIDPGFADGFDPP